jgi:serine/threonine-protein kinase
MLGLLTLLTSAAGALGSYLLAQRLAQPLRVLKASLAELAKGNYAYRISETRRDEFGELYSAFDAAAEALEKRHDTAASPAVAPPADSARQEAAPPGAPDTVPPDAVPGNPAL